MVAPMSRLPEQTFFTDPALDRTLGVVMTLASEVYVLRDRLRRLERVLDAKGIIATADLDRDLPSEAEARSIEADRDAFVKNLLDNLQGVQQSKGFGR